VLSAPRKLALQANRSRLTGSSGGVAAGTDRLLLCGLGRGDAETLRVTANVAVIAGLIVLAALLYIEIEAASEGCEVAIHHFGVKQCDDNFLTFFWPVLGMVVVTAIASVYNVCGGRKVYLLLTAAAFLLFAIVSAFGAFMLVGAAAWANAALA